MKDFAVAVTHAEIAERNCRSLCLRRGWDRIAHLLASYKVEKRGENQIHGNHQKNRHDDSRSGRAADLLCPRAGRKTFLAANSGDGHAEHEALDEAADDVAHEKRITGRANITSESKAGL